MGDHTPETLLKEAMDLIQVISQVISRQRDDALAGYAECVKDLGAATETAIDLSDQVARRGTEITRLRGKLTDAGINPDD